MYCLPYLYYYHTVYGGSEREYSCRMYMTCNGFENGRNGFASENGVMGTKRDSCKESRRAREKGIEPLTCEMKRYPMMDGWMDGRDGTGLHDRSQCVDISGKVLLGVRKVAI